MTAAIAVAIVLVIAVAGASMALESQRTGQPPPRRPTRPARPPRTGSAPGPVRRPRIRDRAKGTPDPAGGDRPPPPMPIVPEPESKGPELLRTGAPALARVISVVDERTIGPVTRSRLALRIEPDGAESFEVTLRHAFPTPEARSQVKVGGTLAVRYDRDDHTRVVVDLPQQ